MKLTRFRVTNFRSVKDSGWVDVDDVTALIGVNESGKTNLLLPLWKLNPALDGEIPADIRLPEVDVHRHPDRTRGLPLHRSGVQHRDSRCRYRPSGRNHATDSRHRTCDTLVRRRVHRRISGAQAKNDGQAKLAGKRAEAMREGSRRGEGTCLGRASCRGR